MGSAPGRSNLSGRTKSRGYRSRRPEVRIKVTTRGQTLVVVVLFFNHGNHSRSFPAASPVVAGNRGLLKLTLRQTRGAAARESCELRPLNDGRSCGPTSGLLVGNIQSRHRRTVPSARLPREQFERSPAGERMAKPKANRS